MPVRRLTASADEPAIAALRGNLVKELTSPKEFGQPIILEDPTPETDSMRVYVIWDDWAECPREHRAQAIVEAYKEVRGDAVQLPITLASGLTVPEASSVGLLPYQIAPPLKKDPQVPQAEYRKAMIDLGASTLLGSDNPQLRLPTLKDAEAAIEHLEKALPRARWILIREVPEASSSSGV